MREQSGRTNRAIANVTTGLISKVSLMVLAFATRTIFIRLLGANYTGVSSLYSNILSVLSLAELGLGNVLTFYLYGALKNKDENKIVLLVLEFKKIYRIIILGVLSVGIALIPALKFIVRSDLNSRDLVLYYCLYLINSVASYFVVYRTVLITADQKSYIGNAIQTISTAAMYVFQIAYLFVFQNFLGYLIIQILCTVAYNVIMNAIALKMYPYLSNKPSAKEDVVNRSELLKNIKATFLFKVADTILDQTDSIIISILFGTIFVGYYSNYFMLVTYLVAIAGIIANGLVAGFGNLNAEGDIKKSYEMFQISLMGFAMFGTFCTTCYACIVQDFIPVWVGKQYLMDYGLVVAVLAVFYLRMVTNTVWMYRSAMGIFQDVQYINIIAAVLNIFLSLILGKFIGVPGVIVATAVSRLATSFWFEGKVVYKRFEEPVKKYYIHQLKDFCVCIVATSIALLLCNIQPFTGIFGILVKLLISGLVAASVEIIVYHKTPEYNWLKERLKTIIGKRMVRNAK